MAGLPRSSPSAFRVKATEPLVPVQLEDNLGPRTPRRPWDPERSPSQAHSHAPLLPGEGTHAPPSRGTIAGHPWLRGSPTAPNEVLAGLTWGPHLLWGLPPGAWVGSAMCDLAICEDSVSAPDSRAWGSRMLGTDVSFLVTQAEQQEELSACWVGVRGSEHCITQQPGQ